MTKSNRFSALRQLRDQRQEDETLEQTEPELETTESPEKQDAPAPTPPASQSAHDDDIPVPKPKSALPPPDTTATSKKRGPGRPRGRRSNPEYTQISAYIPLELLLEVQDELTEERRAKKQRTPRPVSDLMEELLANWLKKRKRKISDI